MSYIQPTFRLDRIEVRAVGAMREAEAAHLSHLLTVGREYYRYRDFRLDLEHARLSARGKRLLRSTLEALRARSVRIELAAQNDLKAFLLGAGAIDAHRPRPSIGFGRRTP